MKNKKHLLNLLLAFGLGISSGYAQESSNASGGDASGSGGTVAYSIGQVAYTYQTGTNGDINQGVQQALEIYTVGINEEPTNISLKAFPNPTSDFLSLQFEDYTNEQVDYKIFDLNGKMISSARINGSHTQIDLTSLVKGTYLIEIIEKSKKNKTFKIIKN